MAGTEENRYFGGGCATKNDGLDLLVQAAHLNGSLLWIFDTKLYKSLVFASFEQNEMFRADDHAIVYAGTAYFAGCEHNFGPSPWKSCYDRCKHAFR
jgi:hypothetical protein